MTSIKKYTAIFGALMVISTTQYLVERLGLVEDEATYLLGFALIIALSTMKALAVAGWFMHLREEPRSITYIMVGGLICVLALTAGAGYSIM